MPRPLTRSDLLAFYEDLPFGDHPLWRAVRSGQLSREQIVLAETQHFVRTKVGRELRKRAVEDAPPGSLTLEYLIQTYLEECADSETNVNHLSLVQRILVAGGLDETHIARLVPNGPNAAAIALYKDIGDRGSACHLLGAGVVEHFYSRLTPEIYDAYRRRYGFADFDVETYRIHGDMDADHANRAFAVLDEAVVRHGATQILGSVRDAITATSLHYDAMLYAATGTLRYWDGRS